jgi:hypothetical protein
LVVYYLLALFGEQMARTEKLSPFAEVFARGCQRQFDRLAFSVESRIFQRAAQ